MLNKVKDFCETQLTDALAYNSSVTLAKTRAYGAVMFAMSEGLLTPDEEEELIWWWNDKMLMKRYTFWYILRRETYEKI